MLLLNMHQLPGIYPIIRHTNDNMDFRIMIKDYTEVPMPSMKRIILVLMVAGILLPIPCQAAKGKELTISFVVNKKEEVTPSVCMAIWLEKEDGTYVKTLYASDWLAYGGYTMEGICPTWVEKASWATNETELPDAISGATPRFGQGERVFQFKKKDLPAGSYKFCIQVHLTADYNELYTGVIELGKEPSEAAAEVSYSPGKHETISGVLSEVSASFK
jgi:hypothetical protein